MKTKKILPIFSYLFHPLFVPLYGTLYYFFVTKDYFYTTQIYVTLIQVVIITLFLPITSYYLFRSLGIVTSFTEASLQERRIPILTQGILLLLLVKFSLSKEVTTELFYFFLGGLISTVIVLLALLVKFKASLHMIGVCAFTTFLYGLGTYYQLRFDYLLALSIICVGLVASSRLYMKAHTYLELIIGSLIGIAPQVFLFNYWL